MIEKLAEFCRSHNLAFLIEYDGDKLLRLMFVSNDDDCELLGGARGGRALRVHKPQRRYCQDIFVDTYLKSEDQAAIVDLVIDNFKTAFQID